MDLRFHDIFYETWGSTKNFKNSRENTQYVCNNINLRLIFTYSCLLRFKRVKMANPTTDKASTEQIAITIITVVLSLLSGGAGVKIGVVVDFVGETVVVVCFEGVVF
jgi:hypothetical protein